MNPEWVQQFNIKFISILRNFCSYIQQTPQQQCIAGFYQNMCIAAHYLKYVVLLDF